MRRDETVGVEAEPLALLVKLNVEEAPRRQQPEAQRWQLISDANQVAHNQQLDWVESSRERSGSSWRPILVAQ